MTAPRIGRPSHATVIAYLALFIALSGTAIAATKIGSGQIKKGAVKEKKIATAAVTTNKLADAAVTEPKLANDSVSTSKVLKNTITQGKLADAVGFWSRIRRSNSVIVAWAPRTVVTSEMVVKCRTFRPPTTYGLTPADEK
jgi:hypothetical protein